MVGCYAFFGLLGFAIFAGFLAATGTGSDLDPRVAVAYRSDCEFACCTVCLAVFGMPMFPRSVRVGGVSWSLVAGYGCVGWSGRGGQFADAGQDLWEQVLARR